MTPPPASDLAAAVEVLREKIAELHRRHRMTAPIMGLRPPYSVLSRVAGDVAGEWASRAAALERVAAFLSGLAEVGNG